MVVVGVRLSRETVEYRAAVPVVSCRVTAPAVAKQSDPGPAGSIEVAAGEFRAMCKFINCVCHKACPLN